MESLTASKVVAFAATFPRVLGALPAGDLGVADADGAGSVGLGDFNSESSRLSVGHPLSFEHTTDPDFRRLLPW